MSWHGIGSGMEWNGVLLPNQLLSLDNLLLRIAFSSRLSLRQEREKERHQRVALSAISDALSATATAAAAAREPYQQFRSVSVHIHLRHSRHCHSYFLYILYAYVNIKKKTSLRGKNVVTKTFPCPQQLYFFKIYM